MAHIQDSISKIKSNTEPGQTSTGNQPSTPLPERTAPACPECGGAGYFRRDVPVGHPDFGRLIRCTNEAHSGELLKRLAKLSGLKPNDLNRRLSDIRPDKKNGGNIEALDACQKIIDDPFGWLWLWGGPGNAKSEMLIAVVNELNLAGKTGLYITLSRLVEYMREAFYERQVRQKANDPLSVDLGYIDRFEKMLNVPVLAIDEMDKIRETDFAMEFRFHFLDERYRQAIAGETVTLFASNENPNSLPEAIWDRVRDGRFQVIENRQPSARPAMKRGE